MKYPEVLLITNKNYISQFIKINNDINLLCSIIFIHNNNINLIFSDHYPIILICNLNLNLPNHINYKAIKLNDNDLNVNKINSLVIDKFIVNLPKRIVIKPDVSIFTTSFNSFDKINRPLNSIISQKFNNWEWIIIDDSNNDDNFNYMRQNIIQKYNDPRIKIFRKSHNSGYIGEVKNEAIALCSGSYIFELDHDDELSNNNILDIAVKGFNLDSSIGFIYMNFSEIYENGENFNYGDVWAYGYGSYYKQYYEKYKKWIYVANSADINNITMSNIIGVPNHPRIWKRECLLEIGSYSKQLSIADDYEVLLLTLLKYPKYKMLKIPILAYIQYKNNNNNNFSLIRNTEITKLQDAISKKYYEMYSINDFFSKYGINEVYNGDVFWNKNKSNKINLTLDVYNNVKTLILLDINKINNEFISKYYNDKYQIILCVNNTDEVIEEILNKYKLFNVIYYNFIEYSQNQLLNYVLKTIATNKNIELI